MKASNMYCAGMNHGSGLGSSTDLQSRLHCYPDAPIEKGIGDEMGDGARIYGEVRETEQINHH